MNSRIFISLIDLAFLTLAAIVAVLSQTQMVRALPVDVTEIDKGVALVTRDAQAFVTIAEDGLYADGQLVELEFLDDAVDAQVVVIRVDRNVPTERLIEVMSELAPEGVEFRIEVEERYDGGALP